MLRCMEKKEGEMQAWTTTTVNSATSLFLNSGLLQKRTQNTIVHQQCSHINLTKFLSRIATQERRNCLFPFLSQKETSLIKASGSYKKCRWKLKPRYSSYRSPQQCIFYLDLTGFQLKVAFVWSVEEATGCGRPWEDVYALVYVILPLNIFLRTRKKAFERL